MCGSGDPSTGELMDERAAQEALDAAARALRAAATRVRRAHRGDPDEAQWAYCRLASEACGIDETTGDARHTPAEVREWIERAVAMGCERPSLGPIAIERLYRAELIPNARLRQRFEELERDGEISSRQLALRIGETRGTGRARTGDPSRVERMLGVRPTPGSRGSRPFLRLFVSYDQAVLLATALGVPYHEIGV